MTITVPLPAGLAEADFDNLQNLLGYVSADVISFRIDRTECRVELAVRETADRQVLEEKIAQLVRKVRPLRQVKTAGNVVDRLSETAPCRDDVFAQLVEKREVIEHAPGIFSLHGKLQRMFRRLDESMRNYALEQGAEEVTYPVTISLGTLQKSKFFSHYPQFANFISVLESDTDNISAAAKKLSSAEALDFLQHLKIPACMCRSAGCLHAYPSYEGHVFEPGQQVSLTMIGRMFRNEAANIHSLERLHEYSMREIIYLGSAEFVRERLAGCIEWCKAYLEHFEMQGVIQTANDPFFADNLAALQFFQRSEQSKYEFRLINPSTGNSVSVASVNMHAEHFSKAYDIRFPSGDFIQTGCFGVGFERILFLTFAQFGYDETAWPESLREFYFGPNVRSLP